MSVGALPHEAYLTAMSVLEGLGPSTLRRLASLGDPADTWVALRRGTLPVAALGGPGPGSGGDAPTGTGGGARPGADRRLEMWRLAAQRIDPAQIWDRLRHHDVGVASLGAAGYPQSLLDDPDPPVLVFHRGDLCALDRPTVAVVGTRRATAYGLDVAHQLGRGLAEVGVCVVSGLALGIDAAAHAGACSADGAGPAAVVAAGLDAPCPVANRALARRVAACGLLLSEVPVGVSAQPWRFPVRNRIIAALAQVVVVVESAARGGSMSTVEHATTRGRTVLAVPGPVGVTSSAGTNALIADGAGVCTSLDDVLTALGLSSAPAGCTATVDRRPEPVGSAGRVLGALGWRPEWIEFVVDRLGEPVPAVVAALGWLETNGWVRLVGGFVERRSDGARWRPPGRAEDPT